MITGAKHLSSSVDVFRLVYPPQRDLAPPSPKLTQTQLTNHFNPQKKYRQQFQHFLQKDHTPKTQKKQQNH